MTEAYLEGFMARLAGTEVDANPYPTLTESWTQWASGWMDQDQHLNERDEALDSIGWFG